MNIIFDIGYDIRGRRHGRRLRCSYRFRETVSAEIPEVHPDDAPVAVSWKARRNIEKRWVAYDEALTCGDANGMMMTRWHDGRHWLRLVEGNCGKTVSDTETMELSPSAAARAINENRRGAPLALGIQKFAPHLGRAHPDPLSMFEDVVTDERAVALDAVSAISDNYISVAGVLHVACAQPGIRLNDSGRIRSYHGFAENLAIETRARFLDGSAGYRREMICFPLADWDEIYRRTCDQALDSGAPRPEPHLVRPEIHVPESIDPDVDARRAVDMLVKNSLTALRNSPDRTNPKILEFFDSDDKQRINILETLLDHISAVLPIAQRNELLRRVEEIEDCMSIGVDLASVPPSPQV